MADYPYFPMFVDLSQKRVLIVGGGRIAARRIRTMVQFTPHVTVVAPDLLPELEELEAAGKITVYRRGFESADLDGADLVLAATNDESLNRRICQLGRERGLTVNVGSDKSLCDFYFPGIVRRGAVVVGVTASGTDHALAKQVRQDVEKALDK